MEITSNSGLLLSSLISEKENLRDNFTENPKATKSFYDSLKGMEIDQLKKIFPAPRSIIDQGNFNAMNEIIWGKSIEDMAFASMALFRRKNTEKSNLELFEKDMRFLHGIFFFFLNELFGPGENENLFAKAIQSKKWFLPETQAEILNQFAAKSNFLKEKPFADIDFTKFAGNQFEANESILRLIANFSAKTGNFLPKEKIISEMNFIREQQKKLLHIYPNTRKEDYSESTAEEEIAKALDNLSKLKEMDFGFEDSSFTQILFADDEKLRKPFARKVTCKFFAESEMAWKEKDPRKVHYHGKFKIIARKDDRFTNKSALTNKFLYPERNMITHISENFAIYSLFGKEYKKSQQGYWEGLLLHAFYDAHEYLLSLLVDDSQRVTVENLLTVLNHYFKRIVKNLDVKTETDGELWAAVFDAKGRIIPNDWSRSNIYAVFSSEESKISHLRRFMSFLYCTGNEDSDFIEKNRLKIQLYLIYLTFEFSKLDVFKE